MEVDVRTLRDLEVLQRTTPGPTVVDHLDRTTTKGGRRALLRRLTRPLGRPEDIENVQASLRFLLDTPEVARRLPGEREVAAVGGYLDSRLMTLRRTRWPGTWWEAGVVRLRYPEVHTTARESVPRVRGFLERLDRLAGLLEAAPPPLAGLADSLREGLDAPEVARVRAGPGRGPPSVSSLVLDAWIRNEARPELRALLEGVWELDALLSMATATRELGFVLPEVRADAPGLELEGVVHPFLREGVANDLALVGAERVLFLTGPNMAGKSTFLKACGLVVLLAHCGMGVPARSARLAPAARLLTAIRTEDDLADGVSYFQAEARRVERILARVSGGRRCVVIADELFRGTNVEDAREATGVVLRGFCRVSGSVFLVASHLAEVGEALAPEEPLQLRHFRASTEGGGLYFDRRLRPGASTQRLGMEVLRREGVLDRLAALGAPVPVPGAGEADAAVPPQGKIPRSR